MKEKNNLARQKLVNAILFVVAIVVYGIAIAVDIIFLDNTPNVIHIVVALLFAIAAIKNYIRESSIIKSYRVRE